MTPSSFEDSWISGVHSGIGSGLPTWAVLGLAVIGTAMIITDVLWSTTSSDWMKYRREMKFAQTS